MLIITADDLGRDRATTDACLNCFRRRRITSASIMVFMKDSERAAELAVREGLETGLHLNLVLPFDASGIAGSVSKSQGPAVRFFRRGPWTQVIYDPFITRSVASSFVAQLEEYRRLFGKDPVYYNGHRHFHLSLNMVLGGSLPSGAAVRRGFTFYAGEKGRLNRWFRRRIDIRLLRRCVSTDAFFSLKPVSDFDRLTRIVHLARTASVELMVHPGSPDELAVLTGDPFRLLIASARLGGFEALRSDAKGPS
jgi:predicted glycoside hydrolase/deacetylase ChbG (UPF0249 family)